MKKPAVPLPIIKDRKLYISSPDQQAIETRKAIKLTQYRRDYWQGYKARVRRVYGTICPREYEAIKTIATQNETSVWQQVLSDARAYRSGVVLAPRDTLLAQDNLVGELRRIGNNINQLAKLGHIQAKKTGGLVCNDDDLIGRECLKQFARLEKAVTQFDQLIPEYVQPNSSTEANI